jgi:hypothetical protein
MSYIIIISSYYYSTGDLNQDIIGLVPSLKSKEFDDIFNKYIYDEFIYNQDYEETDDILCNVDFNIKAYYIENGIINYNKKENINFPEDINIIRKKYEIVD